MFALTVRAPWGKNAYFNAETLWVRERERERERADARSRQLLN